MATSEPRRRFQFSLNTIFISVTVLAIAMPLITTWFNDWRERREYDRIMAELKAQREAGSWMFGGQLRAERPS